jgi:pimeloyl-ACP methyl ester carboxylesterase
MPDIEIAGATLHCEVAGTGAPILLIPGLGLDHTYYRFGIPLLARRMQVLAVDPRGVGRSTNSPPPYSVESWADDFAGMIDKLGFGPIHVLGSSLGGAIALALAQRHPGRLKSLTVVGGFSEHAELLDELEPQSEIELGRAVELSDEVADYMGLWTLTRKFINSDAGYAVMRANQANIRTNSAESYSAFVEALLRWGRCQPGQDQEPKFTSLLSSIRLPTLVVTSDNDHLIPKELSDLIAARIAGATLAVMPGAGHIPFMEQPENVVRIVLDFIEGLGR